MTVSIPRQASRRERGFLRSPGMSSTPMRARFATLSGFALERTNARTGLSAAGSGRQISPPKPTGPVAPTTRYMIKSSANPHEAALPGLPLLHLYGCLHAFENHRILKRHEVIEGSLVKRIFAEESEHPVCADHLAARERDVIPRQIVGLGDGGKDPSDELAFPLDWQPRRDDESNDRAKCGTDFAIDAILIGRPLAKKDSCVRDQVGVVDE